MGNKKAHNRIVLNEGDIIGRDLIYVSEAESEPRKRKVIVKCICGNQFEPYLSSIRSMHTLSCGCLQKERVRESNRTHGLSKTKEYKAWISIKKRCYNEKNSHFKYYGGIGIKMSESWVNSFENFINDVGTSPSKLHTIDRISVYGDYEKNNVKWSTVKEQNNNKRKTKYYEYRGDVLTASQFCDKYKLNFNLIRGRIYKGWSIQEAIEGKSAL